MPNFLEYSFELGNGEGILIIVDLNNREMIIQLYVIGIGDKEEVL